MKEYTENDKEQSICLSGLHQVQINCNYLGIKHCPWSISCSKTQPANKRTRHTDEEQLVVVVVTSDPEWSSPNLHWIVVMSGRRHCTCGECHQLWLKGQDIQELLLPRIGEFSHLLQPRMGDSYICYNLEWKLLHLLQYRMGIVTLDTTKNGNWYLSL